MISKHGEAAIVVSHSCYVHQYEPVCKFNPFQKIQFASDDPV